MLNQAHNNQNHNEKDRRTILLITSGYHLYREYLLRQVAQAADVWLLCDKEPEWEHPYITGFRLVDTLHSAAMVQAARDLPADVTLDGVLCWDELRMVQTAEVAKALGLPNADPNAVRRCRDKHLTRKTLARHAVPQARSALAQSYEDAREIAEQTGYPVVLKPRALGASFGVSLVENAGQLKQAYDHAQGADEDDAPKFDTRVLVEEFLDGPEISIDSACVEGKVTPLYLARKESGYFPHFESLYHMVDANDPLLSEPAVIETLNQAHAAVGYRSGITHTELRLTKHGPKIVEINARFGGDMIPCVGWVANGIDPGRIAVQVACCDILSAIPTRNRFAAVRFLYPASSGTVESVNLDEDALPPSVEMTRLLATPGQKLILPPDDHVSCRYAYVIAHGDSPQDCEDTLDEAEKAFSIRLAQAQALETAANV